MICKSHDLVRYRSLRSRKTLLVWTHSWLQGWYEARTLRPGKLRPASACLHRALTPEKRVYRLRVAWPLPKKQAGESATLEAAGRSPALPAVRGTDSPAIP